MDKQEQRTTPNPLARRYWWLGPLMGAGIILGAGILLIVILGLAQRVGWISAGGPAASAPGGTEQIYTCPMHPEIRQPQPGRCPICGMELVVAAAGGSADKFAVHIDPVARRLAHITTATAKREPVESTIRAVGAIAFDESRLATIAAYVDARIERLVADYTGVKVRKGDELVVLYSPELYGAQIEFLEAKKGYAESAELSPRLRETQHSLVQGAKQKLVELGMTEEQVALLEKEGEASLRIKIHAPIGGTVTEKLAVEGQYIKKGEMIYKIADLSMVWLMLEMFPEDAARIRYGQTVQLEVQSLPGETFEGRVAFIDPMVDAQTRTVGVRVEIRNEHGKLRPGDYATAKIAVPIGPGGEVYDPTLAGKWISPRHPQIIQEEPGVCPICGIELVPTSEFGYAKKPVQRPPALVIPRDAVLVVGDNSAVYVETEPGRFELRPVTLGPIAGNKVVVLKGVRKGEKVARSGNFLIDSQMQLAGNPSLISMDRYEFPTGPLDLEEAEPQMLTDDAGRKLEALYQAYLAVQKTLAADKQVSEEQAGQLHQSATALTEEAELHEDLQEHVGTIATNAEHLHHQSLDESRKSFKTISHAILRLAARVRAADAEQVLFHIYCPMVKGGGGDWLQDNDRVNNPYWGSKMLRCGEKVHRLTPARVARIEKSKTPPKNADPHAGHKH